MPNNLVREERGEKGRNEVKTGKREKERETGKGKGDRKKGR